MTEEQPITLTNGQRSMLWRFGYFFTITFFKKMNGVVYYKICYGKTNDDNPSQDARVDSIGTVFVRYSELYDIDICRKKMPSKTLFNHTDESFIIQRLKDFKEWIAFVLEKEQKGEQLFKALEEIRFKQSNK